MFKNAFNDKKWDNNTLSNPALINTIVFVTKPLDIINSSELLYQKNIQWDSVLWITSRRNKKPARMVAEYFNKNKVKNVVYMPNANMVSYFEKITRIKLFGEVFKIILAPLAYLWWWGLFFYCKYKFSKYIEIKNFMLTPVATKIFYLSILKPEFIYFYDGGFSTILKGFLKTFIIDGSESMIKKAVKWKGYLLPKYIYNRILGFEKQNIFLFTTYASELTKNIIINDYSLMNSNLLNKKIANYAILLGKPDFRDSDKQLLNKLELIVKNINLKKVLYKPHPREKLPYIMLDYLDGYDIEVFGEDTSIELFLIDIEELPSYIFGINSSALFVIEKALKDRINIINLVD